LYFSILTVPRSHLCAHASPEWLSEINNPFIYEDELWGQLPLLCLRRSRILSGNLNATENVANNEAFCGSILFIPISVF